MECCVKPPLVSTAKAVRNASYYGVAAAAFFFIAALSNILLTQTMYAHMLVHIPLIFISGSLAAVAWYYARSNRSVLSKWRAYNQYGLPGLLAASFVLAYWMVPKALDDVLLSRPLMLAKFCCVFLAGWVFVSSWRRSNVVIKLFFVGDFCWMMAIVGMLYQEQPIRVCNFYLQDDQQITGQALVWLALLLPLLWLLTEWRAMRSYWKHLNTPT